MNFSPFGGHFPASIPSIHQFAAKFSHDGSTSNGLCPPQDGGPSRYPTNSVPAFTQHHTPHQQHIMGSGAKYQGTTGYMNQGGVYTHQPSIGRIDKRQNYDQQHELAQELCAAMLQVGQEQKNQQQQPQNNNEKVKQEREQEERQHQQNQVQNNQANNNTSTTMPSSWQSLATPGSTVADYLSHLPASTLPLSLHHFLKYSAENIKKESSQQLNINNISTDPNLNLLTAVTNPIVQNGTTPAKKKKKKKATKEKKPRPKPGEIRLTTALDGSTLYCCPECHMAYPEKELLEQHLVGHTLERRFVCDICGAGLKRKDHLTRHKQSHNPERPYVCTVCLKAFKRKEQLTLHFVIHSGEKRHICPECGKGFYRKDHLRKHTRSHIARRVKAELSQQGNGGLQGPVAAPGPPTSTVVQALLS